MASKIATNMEEADFRSSAKRDIGFAATPTDFRSALVLARMRDSGVYRGLEGGGEVGGQQGISQFDVGGVFVGQSWEYLYV